MKKVLVAAILGLAAVVSVKAQSAVQLYSTTLPAIVYGTGSGGTLGNGVGTGFTVGVYYAVGSSAASVNAIIGGSTTQGGANNGTLVGSGVTLGTGVGSTVTTEGNGEYYQLSSWVVPGAPTTGNPTVTLVLVAYQTSAGSYEAATIRGHSAAFTMTANSAPTFALQTGDFAPQFAVALIPEPSTFALAGLGLASLLIFRRRN